MKFCFLFGLPFLLSDHNNFTTIYKLVSPTHIKPELYFLCYYSILRSVRRKTSGVILIVFSVLVLFLLNFRKTFINNNTLTTKLWFVFLFVFFILTCLGGCSVKPPYINLCFLLFIICLIFFHSIFF